MKSIKTFFNQIKIIIDKYEEISRISGENFNVFRIIELTTQEVKMHSKFISELLNPLGSHGQGDIFLKLFVQEFNIKDFRTDTAKVYVEKYIGKKSETQGGRIDIYIENSDNKTIIIENKIFADDQENQLVRYHNYNNENIFYLTLFGDLPSEKSKQNLKENIDFKLLSYRENIISWLEKCRKEAVTLPLLREGISHYINLIKFLTGKTRNVIMEEKLINFIISTPENFKIAKTITDIFTSVKIKIQLDFWKALKEEFVTQGINIYEKREISWERVKKYYNNSGKYYGLWLKIFEHNKITVHYGIEIEEEIYYGFTIEEQGEGGISNEEKFKEIVKKLKTIDNRYNNNKWWLGWKYTEPKLNFKIFNSDNIYSLSDKEVLHKIVKRIVIDSINNINELTKFLNLFYNTQNNEQNTH